MELSYCLKLRLWAYCLMRRNAVILVLFALLTAVSCTTRKDGFAYRVFHNTTARYNGYFYAKEAMKEARGILKENHDEDWDEVLPLFIYGNDEDSEQIFPLMERAIEKSSRVIGRHKMEPAGRSKKPIKRPEMNKWIDDNYLLIGQGYFYKRNYLKAEEIFLYVSRKYKEKEMQAKSNTWLARCYMQREQYNKAKNAILKAAQLRDIEEETRADAHLVYADLLIRLEEWKDATEQVELGLRYIKKKREQARPTFVLAQLMQKQAKASEAIAYYNAVLKLRPEYEMEFYAQIMQALAFDRRGGNAQRIKDILFKLLKDDKNIEYQDVIFYALAEIALEEQNRDLGIEYLETSLAVTQGNQKQQLKGYIRLADLYLEDKTYLVAQQYYDSASVIIEEKHPRYKDVLNKAESLTELVQHLNIIADRDSINTLCDMPEDELMAKLEQIRDQMVREREEARLAAERAALAASKAGGASGQGTFWPYNPQLRESGKMNFLSFWGDRELEDHWRRRNKISMSFGDGEEEEEEELDEEALTEAEEPKDDIPSVEEMFEALPCSEEEREQAMAEIAEAYYRSGIVYKEKLEDLENGIEQWEVLVTEYDESEFHATSFYLLFRSYKSKESEGYQNPFCGTCNSAYWGDIILERYPGSEWAMLVENPDHLDAAEVKKREEREAYEVLLNLYYQRIYQTLLLKTGEVIENEPENHLICKYRLLNALAIGGMDGMTGQRNNHIESLRTVISECPDTEEAAFAQERLRIISGDPKPKSAEVEEEEVALNVSPFTYDASSRHYFMIVMPLKGGDVNKIKAALSDFGATNYKSLALKVSSNLIDRNNQVVLVKTFNRIDDAKSFYALFQKSDVMKDIRSEGYPTALISKENYVTLFKNKDLEAYKSFFDEKYN